MRSIQLKSLLPHAVAVVVFLLVTVIFCKPALTPGVRLVKGHDVAGWEGMSKQSFDYKEKHGHFPLWTNSMFSGMPGYQIAMDGNEQILKPLSFMNSVLSLGLKQPLNFFFLAALFFYIMCVIAGVNPWISILGGITYAFATYNPIIISVGHNTKMMAMAYAPMIFAGLILLTRKKYLLGFTFTAFFATGFIGQNHPQIVFYTLLSVGLFFFAFFIQSLMQKELIHALKVLGLGIFGGLIGLACNATILMPTYDYSKETMRGGVSQLTLNKDDKTNKTKGGLNKDYAMKWSMGKMETFTFMVPGLYGGSNGGNEHSADAEFVQAAAGIGMREENALGTLNQISYWGSMSEDGTSGPAYLGAIICLLFIFGLVFLKGWQKWGLLSATFLGMMLGWGSNFYAFNSFMLDYFPMYNKFRAPSMAMVIPQLCIPFIGVLGLQQLLFGESEEQEIKKKMKLAFFGMIGIAVILFAFVFTTDYTGKSDKELQNNLTQQLSGNNPANFSKAESTSVALMEALRADRKSQATNDLMRSLLLICIAGAIIYFSQKKKIPFYLSIAGLITLMTYDLLSIDKRYLNEDKFTEATEEAAEFLPSPADQLILKDPDHANFRVFNTTTNFTNESNTSYFHNSIGGYHPAKLGLYQDLIEHQLSKRNSQVLNMLNTKYVIVSDDNGQPQALRNDEAYGNCWLVRNIKYVQTPNEEMLALDSTNLKEYAIINQSFKSQTGENPVFDSTANIKVLSRDNDHIVYSSNAKNPQLAVFSEIYYNRGWNAYLDGKPTDYIKANYLLRAMKLPAGQHKIEFKFEPKSYFTGVAIAKWSILLLYLMLIATMLMPFLKKEAKHAE